MIRKNYIILPILIAISGCSLIPERSIQIESKPIQIDIMQPDLPRPVNLTAPKWFVVSEAKIVNPCRKTIPFDPPKFNDEGVEQLKRPKTCELDERENPDWPVGYTYLDQFMDEMKRVNNGEILFVATTIGDYKVMAEDMQELKRYIKQLGEVVIYYRNVTMPDGSEGVGVAVKKNETNSTTD
tara:strand:- start:1 stop:549 length:549 start_codon:yes stop_codon:yes gene_type:complete